MKKQKPKPVAEFIGRRRTPEGTAEFWGVMLCDFMNDPIKGTKLYTIDQIEELEQANLQHIAAAPVVPAPVAQLSEPPEGSVLVPKAFMQGFRTLAHNYSLTAEAPCYYSGVESDAFSSAYRRCGQDLARLRDLLAAAPTTPKD